MIILAIMLSLILGFGGIAVIAAIQGIAANLLSLFLPRMMSYLIASLFGIGKSVFFYWTANAIHAWLSRDLSIFYFVFTGLFIGGSTIYWALTSIADFGVYCHTYGYDNPEAHARAAREDRIGRIKYFNATLQVYATIGYFLGLIASLWIFWLAF